MFVVRSHRWKDQQWLKPESITTATNWAIRACTEQLENAGCGHDIRIESHTINVIGDLKAIVTVIMSGQEAAR